MRRSQVTALLLLLGAERNVAQGAEARPEPAPETMQSPASPTPQSEGWSEEEAVLRALKENPGLRAFRKQRAVAEAQIVSASAIENPSLQFQLVHVQTGSQMGFATTLKWAPPQPVVWSASRSLARAHVEQVRFEIAEQEWLIATQVRLAHTTLLLLKEQRRLYDQLLSLRRRLVELVKTRVGHGSSTRIELNQVQLSTLYAQRDLDELSLRQTESQSQLHSLLGILSATPLSVRGSTPTGLELSALADPDALAEQALLARPALKAAQTRIVQREQAVRVEKAKRWPWFELSGRYRHTTSVNYPNEGLVGIEIPLPILNLNSGPIQVTSAELDLELALAQAAFQNLKQSVYAAYAEVSARRSIVLRYHRDVLPVIAEHEQLLEQALKDGQIDLVTLLSSEESALRGQREFNEARLALRRAWLALEAAVGTPLTEGSR